jgi:hypothetical protein
LQYRLVHGVFGDNLLCLLSLGQILLHAHRVEEIALGIPDAARRDARPQVGLRKLG